MFKRGTKVICIDAAESGGNLEHMKVYVVTDCGGGFVNLEGVKGDWHETRFIAWEE
jgi:hypothetical protein